MRGAIAKLSCTSTMKPMLRLRAAETSAPASALTSPARLASKKALEVR